METSTVKTHKYRKFKYILGAILIIGFVCLIWMRYFFVFGEGIKAGELNYVVKKGFVFKTYEGKIIQSGFRGRSKTTSGNAIQSYEFEFSIADRKLAERLMLLSGDEVQLHYKEYLHPLPWRGYSKYVVDEIVSDKPLN